MSRILLVKNIVLVVSAEFSIISGPATSNIQPIAHFFATRTIMSILVAAIERLYICNKVTGCLSGFMFVWPLKPHQWLYRLVHNLGKFCVGPGKVLGYLAR